jgi:hypothetical protein
MHIGWNVGANGSPERMLRSTQGVGLGRLLALLALTVTAGCGGKADDGCVYGCGGGDGVDDTQEDTADPVDTEDSGDSGDSGEESEQERFDEPGDVVQYEDDDGEVFLDLSDESSEESNQDHEFLYVIINYGASSLGYQLSYVRSETDDGAEGPPPPSRSTMHPTLSQARQRLRDARQSGRVGTVAPPDAPPPDFTASDIGKSVQEYRVRSSEVDDTDFALVDATLWAVGSSVNIWVDNDWPIDWDYDCDGVADQPDSRDANGFDNCDLQVIADAIDANIYPTLAGTFGQVSDVNGDGKVTVVITPVLNAMTAFVEDEEDIGKLVRSYVDPETDLSDYDISENPLSDEQEVIYVFAPDANGFANAAARTTVEAYTQMELLAEVARGFVWLMSYKYKVIDGGGEPEQAWMLEGLSAMGADLTGFGAVYYDDVWDYLDAPNLTALVDTDDSEVISTSQWGAQYLFFRWLYENASGLLSTGGDTGSGGASGSELMALLIQNTSAGVDNVESVTGRDMKELVVGWQVALATAGLQNSSGDPLVDESEWPSYGASTTISAPITSPEEGDLYGANGYQTGINISGINRFMEGGTTSSPIENEDRRVKTDGADFQTLVTGIDYYGFVSANYGAQVVRLADIPYEAATLRIDASGSGYIGVVVRLNDPGTVDFAVENIFSSTDPTSLELPALPTDGSPVHGYGEVQPPGVTYIAASGGETAAEVADTDRWILDLSDRGVDTEVEVAVHLTRRHVDANGTEGPSDPWVAVVPQEAVPNPTTATLQQTCTDDGAISFRFPSAVLEYLYYQVFLSGTSFDSVEEIEDTGLSGEGEGEGEDEVEGGDGFDPCGAKAGATLSCAVDYDRDEVSDETEPQPTTFLQQINTLGCALVDNDLGSFEAYEAADIFDFDELDSDDESYYDRAAGLGGRSVSVGEEAFYKGTLMGGEQYVIVVGAGTGQGAYELQVREVQ